MQETWILIPGGETKIPRATEQLSPCATTRESVPCNKRSHMMQLRPDAAKQISRKKREVHPETDTPSGEKSLPLCKTQEGKVRPDPQPTPYIKVNSRLVKE